MRVSLLGLGSMKFGRTEGLRYPTGEAPPTLTELATLLAQARELGVNLIDTAPACGVSEERLGELPRAQRQHWVLCTKVGESFVSGRSCFDFSAAQTRASVQRSPQRLRTSYLDIVLIHSDGNDTAIIEDGGAFDALAQLQRQGLVRAYGMSHKTVTGAALAVERCDVVMAPLNLAQRAELDVIVSAPKHGCGVLIKRPFDSGNGAGARWSAGATSSSSPVPRVFRASSSAPQRC